MFCLFIRFLTVFSALLFTRLGSSAWRVLVRRASARRLYGDKHTQGDQIDDEPDFLKLEKKQNLQAHSHVGWNTNNVAFNRKILGMDDIGFSYASSIH